MRTPEKSAIVLAALLTAVGCRRDMQDQPKYKPLGQNNFFADGRDSRSIPPNTIARDELSDNDPLHTGSNASGFLQNIPLPVNAALLERGHDRFNIYCSPCHGQTGSGYGMVRQRGFWIPANLHTDRLRSVPPGYIYQVIKNGYGAMPDHGRPDSGKRPLGDSCLPSRFAVEQKCRCLRCAGLLSRTACQERAAGRGS